MDCGDWGKRMNYKEPLSQKAVAISISESDDLSILGLGHEHLRDAMTEVARHLLAMGSRLVYGGDLRRDGFTELLFELVARHQRDADVGDRRAAVLSYLPWPIHAGWSSDEIKTRLQELAGIGELHLLDRNGAEVDWRLRSAAQVLKLSELDWSDSLTAMRSVLTKASDARIVLGGRTTMYKGAMPGVAEETLTALRAEQPLYLLGGFGGCARDIAQDLGLVDQDREWDFWARRDQFKGFGSTSLKNGLTDEENRTLARTVHIDEAIALILRGMLRLRSRPREHSVLYGSS